MSNAKDEIWCDCEGQIWLGSLHRCNTRTYLLMMNLDTLKYYKIALPRKQWKHFGWIKLGVVE